VALNGGEWFAKCSGRFTPGERDPGTHWIGGWVGPRPGVDPWQKIKTSENRATVLILSRI
jgi:hypothetical protein